MAERTWKEIETGFIVDTPGGAKAYRTGDWRSQKPQYDRDRCVRCGVCYIYCPDAAIKVLADGTIEVDEFYCKGCGICARECPTGALGMVDLSAPDEKPGTGEAPKQPAKAKKK